MVHSERPAEQEQRCPTCNVGWLRDKIITDRFEYEVDGKTKIVVAEGVPVRECDNPECRERLSGPEAGRIRHEAICRAFRLLTPREIQAIRDKLGPSQERFAQLTGIGVATISRWERGRLLQNRAMDNYLRLVARGDDSGRHRQQSSGADASPGQARRMSSFIYPTDRPIIDGLRKCIETFHTAFGPSPLCPAPPTAEQLEELLSCAFAASLTTEEGRIVAFTVAFFADQEQSFPYQMKQPVPLSPQDLARLAVALDPLRARICVVPGDPTLQIAGIIHLGEQDAFGGARLTQHQLSIRVLGPGILLVRYGEHLMLTYRRGRFAFHVGESARSDVYSVGKALSFRFSPRSAEQLKADLRFERGLKWIARAMLRQRHGGTVLILPDGADWESKASSKRYAPTAPVTIVKEADAQDIEHVEKRRQAFQQLMQGQPNSEAAFYLSDDMIRARFASELEWLGRLTATDGMTVILPDFTLLGFGVFFDTQENDGDVARVVVIDDYDDGTDHEPKALASIGGARHQSAAVTCRHFPGAIALVASQDGSLSSMTWDAEHNVVVTFRHRELLLDV